MIQKIELVLLLRFLLRLIYKNSRIRRHNCFSSNINRFLCHIVKAIVEPVVQWQQICLLQIHQSNWWYHCHWRAYAVSQGIYWLNNTDDTWMQSEWQVLRSVVGVSGLKCATERVFVLSFHIGIVLFVLGLTAIWVLLNMFMVIYSIKNHHKLQR